VALREKYLTDNPLFLIAGDEFFFNRMEYSLMEPVSKAAFGAVTLPAEWNAESAKLRDEHKVLTIRENRKEAMTLMHDKLQLSPKNLSAQICTLRSLFETLDWNKENHDNAAEDVASTLSIITNADLMRRALLTYREYVKEKEIKVVDNKPMTKGDSIFQRIIEPYKGNVLYVDFWEMSCGPCRAGMLHMRDEVEANKDKPIKYLYITDDTPEHCKSFLEPNNIKGEHIHITHSEWGYLQEKFQFSAIPYTFLVDKQGRRRDDATTEQLLAE
jgi:thiol-disulfide isomerase/thioredoxin